ncbi:hypothetical protein HYH03_002871 [Edaphochlamys debaryana]|uniref:STI1/HOP DP domain-containing protein n=1 Tax=Edaphochlamys debaryana TaxID=47281 RepID=A0A835YAV7_9CHLO|nr:hypothetical protein HYH03_002871 [Edaphochlamys debaryana]|eukprot:KAG2499293.1 hypothetical protein HYH03_002871 [Edaphochlamys debaryana]
MADFDDDDAPPPLSSLSEQVEALKLRSRGGGESTSGQGLPDEAALRVANVVIKKESEKPAPKPVVLKKGFFDAPPPKRKPKPAGSTDKPKPADDIPLIKPRQQPPAAGSGPAIPDFLRVEPSEEQQRYEAMKQQLLDTLKPTPDMVQKVGSQPQLMAGFEDPAVMAAVNDIAANPQNFKKYKNNPKVLAFYQAMGAVMGEKLEKAGVVPGAAAAGAEAPGPQR